MHSVVFTGISSEKPNRILIFRFFENNIIVSEKSVEDGCFNAL